MPLRTSLLPAGVPYDTQAPALQRLLVRWRC